VESETHAQVDNITFKKRKKKQTRTIHPKHYYPDRLLEYIDGSLQSLLDIATRIALQERKPKNKVYSIHEPDTKCISKGKAHKRYEFGQKVSVATTNGGNWIVSCRLAKGNPYDGHTLEQTIVDIESVTGIEVREVYVDRGYKGHDYSGSAPVHIAGRSTRKLSQAQIRRTKRRSAVEPKIGHLKEDHRMRRNYLKGLIGDDINAVLAGAASNMKKLLSLITEQILFMLQKLLWRRELPANWTH
jgi:IS5 family transposase